MAEEDIESEERFSRMEQTGATIDRPSCARLTARY